MNETHYKRHVNTRLRISIILGVFIFISAFVLFDIPHALSQTLFGEKESELLFTEVSDVRYDVAFSKDSITMSLDGAADAENADAVKNIDNVSVTLGTLIDVSPDFKETDLMLSATLFDAAGIPITVVGPSNVVPLVQLNADDNAKTAVKFSFILTKEQLANWSSYALKAGAVHTACAESSVETQPRVDASKINLNTMEEEAIQAAQQREKQRSEELEAEQAAQIRAGNIPTRSSYDGDYSDTLMIGDSIMVLTSSATYSALPSVTIDAVSGRSLEEGGANEGYGSGDGVLDHVRGCDRSFDRFVIGTGNNDGYGMSVDDAEEIIANLDGKQIWFVTEYVSNNARGTANTNDAIDVVCSKYSNVHKIDWYSLVSVHEEWLCGDNCHPQMAEGCEAYATLVKNALDSAR